MDIGEVFAERLIDARIVSGHLPREDRDRTEAILWAVTVLLTDFTERRIEVHNEGDRLPNVMHDAVAMLEQYATDVLRVN
jgi:hypothetical protein